MDISDLEDVEVCRAVTGPTPAVSVVIPAYNRADTIEAAIRSVLAQTWVDFELIVVDDGSSDATVEAVSQMDDPRIGILRHRTNKGPSGARNTGILAASAPIVAFQDSDDIWLPEKLAQQMVFFSDPKVVASYCGMIVTGVLQDVAKPVLHATHPEGYAAGDIIKPLLRRSLISTQTLVARRQSLIDVGLFDLDIRALEDWDLALRLAQVGHIMPAEDLLVVQRFSDNSLTQVSGNWAWAHHDVLLKHEALFADHPQSGALQWGIVSGRFRAIGETKQARLAARRALTLGGLKLKPLLQYCLAGSSKA